MAQIVSNSVQVHIFRRKGTSSEFLLLQRADNIELYPGIWQVVTGWIEENETALEAALREVKEETGLEPIRFWALPYIASFFDTNNDRVCLSPVFAFEAASIAQVHISHEHKEYLWLDYKESLSLLELQSHKEGLKILLDNMSPK
jgi:dATP pyrophosphohydrolase